MKALGLTLTLFGAAALVAGWINHTATMLGMWAMFFGGAGVLALGAYLYDKGASNG